MNTLIESSFGIKPIENNSIIPNITTVNTNSTVTKKQKTKRNRAKTSNNRSP